MRNVELTEREIAWMLTELEIDIGFRATMTKKTDDPRLREYHKEQLHMLRQLKAKLEREEE